MTRSLPSPPCRPLPLRLLLWLYRGLASLQLAVVLIVVLVIVLAWATVVENRFGSDVARFAIYRTGWFEGLNFLLGLNVLTAAVVRFPWKKRHAGFLMTHVGILVLLLGCVVTRQKGIDAYVRVIEADTVHQAGSFSLQHFELDVSSAADEPGMRITVPFRAGPFNWNEYGDESENGDQDETHGENVYETRSLFPWRLGRRDRGVLYDEEGIQLRVLDYYSDSEYLPVPRVKLQVTDLQMLRENVSGHGGSADASRVAMELGCLPDFDPNPPNPAYGTGDAQSLPNGIEFHFWMTGSRAETEAFRDGRPEMPLGLRGNVVLHAGGKKYEFRVNDYDLPRDPNPRFSLGDTGLEVEVMHQDAKSGQIVLAVYRQGNPSGMMWLSSTNPGRNQQDYANGIIGHYWESSYPRVEILRGDDQKLYYRTWSKEQLSDVAVLPIDGSPRIVFDEEVSAPEDDVDAHAVPRARPLEIRVDQYVPEEDRGKPGKLIPKPFYNNKSIERRQALVRLTVDGVSEEFWLEGTPFYPFDELPETNQSKVVQGGKRNVKVRLRWDEFDLGFCVRLRECFEELQPGSEMEKNYTSIVDFLSRDSGKPPLREEATITMNAPVDFTDPQTGRLYRLSQSGMQGPIALANPMYRAFWQRVGDKTGRERVYLSSLGLNYDPGRGLKHAGSLLMIFGVFVVLYTKTRVYRRPSQRDQRGPH